MSDFSRLLCFCQGSFSRQCVLGAHCNFGPFWCPIPDCFWSLRTHTGCHQGLCQWSWSLSPSAFESIQRSVVFVHGCSDLRIDSILPPSTMWRLKNGSFCLGTVYLLFSKILLTSLWARAPDCLWSGPRSLGPGLKGSVCVRSLSHFFLQ